MTFASIGLPLLDFNFLIDLMSLEEIPRLPGDGGPYLEINWEWREMKNGGILMYVV